MGVYVVTWTAILVACLAATPTDCRTHEMLILAPMPTTAFMEAQTRAAEWVTERGMVLKTLTLRPGRGV